MRTLVSGIRVSAGAAVAAGIIALAAPAVLPATQAFAASSCVRFSAANFDAPGDDNYMPQLNQEWVRVKNYCSTTQPLSGWSIHDRGTIHVYRFASRVSIGPGKSITLHSGRGSNTATQRFWQRSYGAVWNNDGDTAYLVTNTGKTVSTR